jgi:hypothetical protein
LQTWRSARADQQAKWAGDDSDALAAAPDSDPSQVKPGDYGPVPVLAARFLTLARSGGLEGLLTSRSTFYAADQTKPLLLLADGAYLEDQARADHLGGDQWGMMNETANYPVSHGCGCTPSGTRSSRSRPPTMQAPRVGPDGSAHPRPDPAAVHPRPAVAAH